MHHLITELRSATMCALLKNTKHKKFFTQEEFEANKGIIYRINSATDTLTKNLDDGYKKQKEK